MKFTKDNETDMKSGDKNSTAWVYKTIREWIVQRKLPAGEKFNQGKLAEELGVSRTPVVKALHKLESEGLVDNIPQKGFFVHQLTVKELLELFALREALDTIIINSIVDTITPDQVVELEALFNPFDNNWTDKAKKEYWEADQKFHNTLFSLCQNDLAKKMEQHFQILSKTYRAGLVREPSETLKEHKAIINALKNRDVETARRVAVDHIGETKLMLQRVVNRLYNLGIDPGKLPVQDLPVILPGP